MNNYKSVYEAIRAKLVAKTERRGKRPVEEWILSERECVLRAVNHQRRLLALEPVEIALVERAERTACGLRPQRLRLEVRPRGSRSCAAQVVQTGLSTAIYRKHLVTFTRL